jgi:hypothetical protein
MQTSLVQMDSGRSVFDTDCLKFPAFFGLKQVCHLFLSLSGGEESFLRAVSLVLIAKVSALLVS